MRRSWWALLVVGIVWSLLMGYGIYAYQTAAEPSPLYALVPWGAMVTGYVFFAISSGGVFDAFAIRLGLYCEEEAKRVARKTLVLALALLIPGIVLVFADLTHVEHSPWIYTGFNATSRIAWNGILYIVYAAFLVAALVYAVRAGEERLTGTVGRALLIGGLLASLALEYNLGSVFAVNVAVPAWFAAPMGVLNIALAFLLGAAWSHIGLGEVATTVTGLTREEYRRCCVKGVSKELAGMAVAAGFMLAWALVQMYSWGSAHPALEELVSGSLSAIFWAGFVLAVPLAIILGLYAHYRALRAAILAGSVLVIIGGFLVLHSIVVAGQTGRLAALQSYNLLAEHALGPGASTEPLRELISNPVELAAFIGGFGLWLLLYTLGLGVLAVEPGEKPRRLIVFR